MKTLLLFLMLTSYIYADEYMLIHGLNNSQVMMNDIEKVLIDNGHKVHRLVLSGHKPTEWNKFEKVSAQIWKDDFERTYKQMKGSKHLVAYSLGALTAIYSQALNKNIKFDSQMLFAPALSTPWYTRLVTFLGSLGFSKLRSFAPEGEGVHVYTSMNAYNALFEMIDYLKNSSQKIPQTPTVVLMDKRDKLVSYKGVKNWIKKKKLNWEMLDVQSTRFVGHMIIAKQFLEKDSWSKVKEMLSQGIR